ncbi:MAG: hypothetical protein HZA64_11960 [Rhodocyclales bacterium]|nr:hypothetical protein [Rhodocyclales bacterium]
MIRDANAYQFAQFKSIDDLIMPRHVVPPNSGPYEVVTSRAGTPSICNAYTGRRKVLIPCRTQEQARTVCRELNEGKHGEVFV